jgi:hypothetical protein
MFSITGSILIPTLLLFTATTNAVPRTAYIYQNSTSSSSGNGNTTGTRAGQEPATITKTFNLNNTNATIPLHFYRPQATPAVCLNSTSALPVDTFGFQAPSDPFPEGSYYKPQYDWKGYVHREEARLKPAIDIRVDAGDAKNIKVTKHCKLPYISSKPANDNTVVAADLAFEFDDDTVLLEHFYDLVNDMKCDSKSGFMWLAFTSKKAIQAAIKNWPVEGGFNIIAPVSGPNCDMPDNRGVYRVTIYEVKEKQKRLKLKFVEKAWKEVATNIEVEFGQLEYHLPSSPEKKLQVRNLVHIIQKRGWFKDLVRNAKDIVGDFIDGVKKFTDAIIDKAAARFDPSISFGVSVGPFGDSDSPFGKALTLYDSSNGGWPKGLTWQQLNKQIKVEHDLKLKKRDLRDLSTEDFLAMTAEAELERAGLIKRDAPWIQAGAWCVNCFAKANLKLTGSFIPRIPIKKKGLLIFFRPFKIQSCRAQPQGTLDHVWRQFGGQYCLWLNG